MVQLVDLSGQDFIKNTHPSYLQYSQYEIVREMKEDFLSVSDDILSTKLNENTRMASYELPDGSQIQMNSLQR